MSDVTNDDRAEWAQAALEAFRDACHMGEEEGEIVLQDLLTDLCHWADREGVDWPAALARGMSNYQEEKEDDASE